MKVYAADDEKLMLDALAKILRATLPEAEIETFRTSSEILAAQEKSPCDVAFLDIRMPGISGLEVARRMVDLWPNTNIVFVTGHHEYKADAMDLYASDYLLKPVTKEKVRQALGNLRHPVKTPDSRFRAITFGNFALYVDGKPVAFHRKKSAELLAYLIDRGGTMVSRPELTLILFEDETHSSASRKQLDNALSTLSHDLRSVGAEEILCRTGDGIAVNRNLLSADLFDYLDHGTPQYCGRYMEQYSWGEFFKGALN